MENGWEGLKNPKAEVPFATKQAQYEINKMFAETFGTPSGRKCLEFMRQNHIGKMFENTCFVEAGAPYLAGRAAVNNFILDIYQKIERAKEGPPVPPEENKDA